MKVAAQRITVAEMCDPDSVITIETEDENQSSSYSKSQEFDISVLISHLIEKGIPFELGFISHDPEMQLNRSIAVDGSGIATKRFLVAGEWYLAKKSTDASESLSEWQREAEKRWEYFVVTSPEVVDVMSIIESKDGIGLKRIDYIPSTELIKSSIPVGKEINEEQAE